MRRYRSSVWTPEQEEEVRTLRASGLLWSDIGLLVGRDGACCRQRIMRTLGEPDPIPEPEVAPEPLPQRPQNDGPLQAGHPTTWGLLVAGTVLAGSAYR